MPIRPFLAMTGAEIREKAGFPPKIAWMACHFSPYCLGLSNLPRELPPGSLLIVDDITPIHGHDPEIIAAQLRERVETLGCRGVLLDFQRPDNAETAALAAALTETLPCPVAVSDLYAGNRSHPVFLSPVPPSVPLAEHLAPWEGREVWLDISPEGECITLTEDGAHIIPLPSPAPNMQGFADDTLHCHYRIDMKKNAANFILWRIREDLEHLMMEADNLGVAKMIGLYQEMKNYLPA